jgi:hypothetical protein
MTPFWREQSSFGGIGDAAAVPSCRRGREEIHHLVERQGPRRRY